MVRHAGGQYSSHRGQSADLDAALDAVVYGDTEAWHEAWAPFATTRARLVDATEGWAVLALCLGLALVVGYFRHRRGSQFPFAPSSKYVAPLVVGLVLLVQYPFITFYFFREVYERGCCPIWADTPSIPVFSFSLMVTMFAGIVALVALLLLRSGSLPAPLLGSPASPLRQVVVSAVALPLVILALFVAAAGLDTLASIVALGLCCAWALLVGRAAALAPRRLQE